MSAATTGSTVAGSSAPVTATAPLSYCQESFLVAAESAVNVPAVVALPGPAPLERVRWLLNELAARHGALRTELTRAAGPGAPPEQRVADAARLELVYEQHDGSVRERLPGWLLAGSQRPFRLLDAPLARAELHAADDRHVLVLWLHHAISDLGTSQVLADEAARLWRGERLPRPVTHMADHARQERGVRPTAAQWRYWERALSGADDTFGLPYPAGPHAGHLIDRPALPVLPADVVAALQRLASSARTTMTAVLAAAAVAAHHETARAERVVLGLTVGNRDQPHLRSVVGCLADQLPLVVGLADATTFRGLVGRVREALLDAYEHRLPLGRLVPLLERRQAPHFAVNLNFLPPATRPAPGGAAPAVPDDLALPYGMVKTRPDAWWLGDATLAYRPRIDGGRLTGELEGDADLHGPARVRRFAERFSGVLERAAREPDLALAALVAGL
ncbi:condensation domain-containing protein [Dactylosporangium sp. CA-233914]|uniref:condensation domain-containing protein n=1 Tax=Dactylosporangium sp. CA-233914 TaxID=3239934 RepID=UPI003D93DCEC